MLRTLHRTSEPNPEVFGLEQVKIFLKEDLSHNDELAEELAISSREWLEDETGMNFGVSGYKLFLSKFIDIVIPRYPLQDGSVVVTYTDDQGADQTMDSSSYTVIDEEIPARLKFTGDLPALKEDKEYPVWITFNAGYTPAKTPKRAITVLKLMVTHYFNHRDLSDKRVNYDTPIPYRVRHLTNQLKARRLL